MLSNLSITVRIYNTLEFINIMLQDFSEGKALSGFKRFDLHLYEEEDFMCYVVTDRHYSNDDKLISVDSTSF